MESKFVLKAAFIEIRLAEFLLIPSFALSLFQHPQLLDLPLWMLFAFTSRIVPQSHRHL
jgi:hypothetical protein